jgi:transcriptional regulator with PAS, ATPase and Fis domain
MVGNSVFIQEIRNCISQLAATSSNVLVTGETGTGKELVAQSIHRKSARAPKPFVCVNCAAIPDTLMESEFFGYERGAFTGAHASKQGKLALAQGGTVFFDEIGDMTTYMQAKILRAIEGKEIQPLGGRGNVPVDFRVIAATNQDLDRLVSEGKFRQDLYFRLNVGWIHVPPLRERKEDIPALIDYYIADMNVSFGRRVEKLDDGALEQLVRYSWPGNIRELRNVLEAAYVRLPSAQTSVLSLPQPFPRRLLNSLEGFSQSERDHLIAVLSATKWNKSATAQKLNWSRMTLYRKMAKYQITRCAVKKSSETRNGSDPGLASDVA